MGMGGAPQGRGMPNLFANILNGGLGGFGGSPMGPPMGMMPGQPPMAAPSYPQPQYSYAPPPQMFAEPRPVQQAPMYMPQGQPVQQPGLSYVPQQQPAASYAPPAMAGQPTYAQPTYAQPARVVQYSQQPAAAQAPAPAAPAVERFLVTISGREGVNDVINGAFQSIGEHGGRYSFSKPTNEGPIYLYYDQASDNWCIGDQIGSQSYYAVCGPSNGQDMA